MRGKGCRGRWDAGFFLAFEGGSVSGAATSPGLNVSTPPACTLIAITFGATHRRSCSADTCAASFWAGRYAYPPILTERPVAGLSRESRRMRSDSTL